MSEREPEPEPDTIDDQPDHTEDPRRQDIGKGNPETGQEGTGDDGEDAESAQ